MRIGGGSGRDDCEAFAFLECHSGIERRGEGADAGHFIGHSDEDECVWMEGGSEAGEKGAQVALARRMGRGHAGRLDSDVRLRLTSVLMARQSDLQTYIQSYED